MLELPHEQSSFVDSQHGSSSSQNRPHLYNLELVTMYHANKSTRLMRSRFAITAFLALIAIVELTGTGATVCLAGFLWGASACFWTDCDDF